MTEPQRINIPNLLINFLRKARYERLIAEEELDDNQLYATTDANEQCVYGDLYGDIEDQHDLYNALCSARIFKKDMCNDPRGYAIIKALKESAFPFDLSKFEVVGNPTITEDGVASNFLVNTSVGYDSTMTAVRPKNFTLGQLKDHVFRIECAFALPTALPVGSPIIYTFGQTTRWLDWSNSFGLYNNTLHFRSRFGNPTDSTANINTTPWITYGSMGMNLGEKYVYVTEFDGIDLYTYQILNAEGTILAEWTYTPSSTDKNIYAVNVYSNEYINIGNGNAGWLDKYNGWAGLIYLKEFLIEIEGVPIFKGYSEHIGTDEYPLYNIEIPYYQSKDGMKIVDVQYKDRVDQLYALTGKDNYIIIDETNEEFRLPLQDIYSQLEGKTTFTLRKWED